MPLPFDKRLLGLIDSLYETAGDQSSEAWLDVYKQMSALISSGPGGLSLYLPDSKQFEVLATTFDSELLGQYHDYYQYINPFHNKIVRMKAGDERFSRVRNCSDKKFQDTEIYQDYFRKQNVFNFEYQAFFNDSKAAAGVTFSRPITMKNFTTAEVNVMQIIIRHLQNAFQIHRKFAELERDKLIISECLEKTSQSVIVLDNAGKAVFFTRSARKFVDEKDGLQINRSGVLSANSPQDAKKLKTLLQSVFKPSLVENLDYAKILQISRPSGQRPLSVFVSPFYEKSGGAFVKETFALLFIKDPDEKAESIELVLRQVYDLTAAEAKLAAILAQGKSINEACGILGVKQNTIRTHLKRIFSKTETTRQSELVKLILSGLINLNKFD